MPGRAKPAHVPSVSCQRAKLYHPLIIVSKRQFYPLWVNFALWDNGGEAAGFPRERVKTINDDLTRREFIQKIQGPDGGQ